jgi:hypothetical protein
MAKLDKDDVQNLFIRLMTAAQDKQPIDPEDFKKLQAAYKAGVAGANETIDYLVKGGAIIKIGTPTGPEFVMPDKGSGELPGKSAAEVEAARAAEQAEAQASATKATAKKKEAAKAAAAAEPSVPRPAVEKPRRFVSGRKPKGESATAAPAGELPELRPKTPGELAAEVTEPGRAGTVGASSVEAQKAVTSIRARNFNDEWAKLPAKKKTDALKRAFGSSGFANAEVRNKAGALALASEALDKAGLGGDKNLLGFDLKAKLREIKAMPADSAVRTLESTHGQVLNKGGTMSARVFSPGSVPAGAVAGATRRGPKLEPRPASPGFETAKKAEIPEGARARLAETAKVNRAEGAGSFSPEELPDLSPTGATPAAGGVGAAAAGLATDAAMEAAAAAATPAPAAPAAAKPGVKGRTPFQEAVLADPAKYGTGFGKGKVKATAEQFKARKALANSLKTPSENAYGAALSEAYASNPTKYGPKQSSKQTPEHKAARKALREKLRPQYFPDESKAAAKAAAAKEPKAPKTPKTTTPAVAPTVPPEVPTPGATAAVPGAAAAAAEAPAGTGLMDKAKDKAKGLAGKAGGVMRFLGPLFAIYGAYQVMSMLRQGTVGAADERRLKALQALNQVGGGAAQDEEMRRATGRMSAMVDLAGMQRQRSLDQMRQQYTGNEALDALLRGQQATLSAIAQPSQPSIAEMMARM